jgi:hypothetical protein
MLPTLQWLVPLTCPAHVETNNVNVRKVCAQVFTKLVVKIVYSYSTLNCNATTVGWQFRLS